MSDFTVNIGPRQPIDAEERRARVLRAAEVLDTAGWVFDERISSLTKDLLGTNPTDTAQRETIFHQIDATAQLKGHLQAILNEHHMTGKRNERRNRTVPAADSE